MLLDIETAPNKCYVWGLFEQNISHDQVEESSYILCWSAKWYGQQKVHFSSTEKQSRLDNLLPMHALLGEADIVIHYNGNKFDIPVLNREFLKHGLGPPSPYKQIDLYRVIKRAFRFESNKLKAILKELDMENKLEHEGFKLWTDCMDGKPSAWRKLGAYNRKDVTILEPLYERLRPWIPNHPNINALETGLACPKCGSTKTQERGVQVTISRVYQRHHCQHCGAWFRSNKSLPSEQEERGVNIAV